VKDKESISASRAQDWDNLALSAERVVDSQVDDENRIVDGGGGHPRIVCRDSLMLNPCGQDSEYMIHQVAMSSVRWERLVAQVLTGMYEVIECGSGDELLLSEEASTDSGLTRF
jgi:hypothetical protein